eukprot:3644468-Pleurochrysis_carterae.AAC.1
MASEIFRRASGWILRSQPPRRSRMGPDWTEHFSSETSRMVMTRVTCYLASECVNLAAGIRSNAQ